MNRWTSAAAAALVVVVGVSSFVLGTDGGEAWTAENARRLAVLRSPARLPHAAITTQANKVTYLDSFGGGLVLMDFIYTRCPTVCLAMGTEFRLWQGELEKVDAKGEVKLLSLSFDRRDSVVDLDHYLRRFSGEPARWTAASINNPESLQQLMHQMGVIAIPDPLLGYVHNAAIYLIDQGRVVGIFDYDDRSALRVAIEHRLGRS